MIFLDEVSSDVTDFLPVDLFGSKVPRQKGKCLANLIIFLDEVSSDVIVYRSNVSDRKPDLRKESASQI